MSRLSTPLLLFAALATLLTRAPAAAQPALLCGETARGSSASVTVLRFDAKQGEVVSITVAMAPNSEMDIGLLGWALFDPFQRLVPTSDGLRVCYGQCETIPLPASGTFQIVVIDLPAPVHATYDLTLEAVSATANGVSNGPPNPTCARLLEEKPDGTRVIDRGKVLDGSLIVPGETDTFTFEAKTFDILRVAVAGDGTVFDPEWALFDPSGHRVPLADGTDRCRGVCDTTPLIATGTFTIKVYDANLDAAGSYSILLGQGMPPTTTTTTNPSETTTTTTTTDTTTTTGVSDTSTTTTLEPETTTTTTTSLPATTTTTTLPGGLPGTPVFELGLTLRPPPVISREEMGTALAPTTNGFLIGAPHDATAAHNAGAVYVVGIEGAPGTPDFGRLLRTLLPPTPRAGDEFGAAVVTAGPSILVGAPGDDTAGTDAGAAYLFSSTPGAPPTLITPATPSADGSFGAAVATVDSQLVVGAPGANAVQVFAPNGAPVLTIVPPDGVPAGARFGAAVAGVDAHVLVGAPGTAATAGRAFLVEAGTGQTVLALASPQPRAGDEFGASVAAAGIDLLVGAPGSGAVFLFDGDTGTLLRTFTKPTPSTTDRFGAAFAITNGGLLIGAPADDTRAPDAGAAYLFDFATGTLLHVFDNAEAHAGDGLGTAVTSFGVRMLVGAPLDDTGMVDGGAAYLFSGTTLEAVFRKRLSAAEFGAAVAAAGSDVLVGAPRGGTGAGSVSRIAAATGQELTTVDSPTAGDPRFGFAVAALGDLLVGGAPFEDGEAGSDVGGVHLFQGNARVRSLTDRPELAGDQFGFAIVAIDQDVLVGAPLSTDRDTGVVHVFDAASGARRMTLQKPTPVTGDFFGAALAAEGAEVLVGAPFDSTAATNAGAAYLFTRATAALEHSFASPTLAEGDLFGASVALSATRVAIGAPLADLGAPDAGAVYVFERATGNLVATLTNPTPNAGDDFGRALALTADHVVVGAQLDDAGGADTGTVYVFNAANGTLLQAIHNPAQGAFDHFGAALSGVDGGVLIGAPGPSRAYLFRPLANIGGEAPASSGFTVRATTRAANRCGNGLVEGNEACDDGNDSDLDDCRNDCTRPICCTLDPLGARRCDDGNPCTDDVFDPQTGCTSVPNDSCCNSDSDCSSGKCRFCVGCFLYPWDCCDQGSTCLALAAECSGTECLASAFCLCEGGLTCAGEAVPALTGTLFTAACDQLRLEESLVAGSGASATTTKQRVKQARKMIRKAAKATRKMMHRHTLSNACGRDLLGRIRSVKQAIPRGKRLRRCVQSG